MSNYSFLESFNNNNTVSNNINYNTNNYTNNNINNFEESFQNNSNHEDLSHCNYNYNGRVFFDKQYSDYNLYEQNQDSSINIDKTISNIQEATPFSQKFFSKENLDTIQNKIIMTIANRHNFRISKQDETQIQIIQRSVYLYKSTKNFKSI